MQTIIATVEETIAGRKQSLRYRREELERIEREIAKEQDIIWMLESELNNLKDSVKGIKDINIGSRPPEVTIPIK